MESRSAHAGANIYCFRRPEQTRLITECLKPLIERLRGEVGDLRVWLDRYDLRGPHVILLLTVPRDRLDLVWRYTRANIDAFFDSLGEGEPIEWEAIELRHAACRGKPLAAPDLEAGLARDRSIVCFEQPTTGYPFRLTPATVDFEAIWQLLDQLCTWNIEQLAAGNPVRTALRWLAHLQRELERYGVGERYWRYHAGTLLLDLPKRLDDDESRTLAALPTVIGERNRQRFDPIWQHALASPPDWEPLPRLLETLDDPAERLPFLRETVHTSLKQLSVHGAFEIPLVLYAWLRSRHP